MDIVITEFMDEGSVKALADEFRVLYDPALVGDAERLAGLMPGVRALIVRNRTRVDENLLNAASDLCVVGRLGVGLDNIDLDACAARGIEVCPATGANDGAVAEYVIASAMVLLRPVYLHSRTVVEGGWPREAGIGSEIAGRTLGLVGFGSIARQAARRAEALGMAVTAYDPYLPANADIGSVVRRESLERLLREAHVVSLHVPLTDSTRGLIDASALALMRQDAVLVNTSRGGVVDEDALAKALIEGRIAGAAVDVFEHEPLTGSYAARFEDVPNLILTPHVAGVTEESNVRVSRVTAENVRRVLKERAA